MADVERDGDQEDEARCYRQPGVLFLFSSWQAELTVDEVKGANPWVHFRPGVASRDGPPRVTAVDVVEMGGDDVVGAKDEDDDASKDVERDGWCPSVD